MAISTGDKIPAGALGHKTADGIEQMSTDDLFAGKKVVLFSVPGAFTPTCSAQHLPGFVQKADERLDRFVKDGYIVLRGLFTPPELAALQSCVEELPSLVDSRRSHLQTVERVKGEPTI